MTCHSDLMKGLNDTSFSHCSSSFGNFGWLSKYLQMNKCSIVDHTKTLTTTTRLKNTSFTKINYSHQSFLHADYRLIELAHSNKWMWSDKPSNWVRLDLNKKCAPPLPTSSGLQWRWHRSCSNKALKVVNSVSHDCDIYCAKTNDFFHVFTLQTLLVGSYQGPKTFLSRLKGQ
jgi:hypothetical protein